MFLWQQSHHTKNSEIFPALKFRDDKLGAFLDPLVFPLDDFLGVEDWPEMYPLLKAASWIWDWDPIADGNTQRAVLEPLEFVGRGCCWEQQLSSKSVSLCLLLFFGFLVYFTKSSPKNLMVRICFHYLPFVFHGDASFQTVVQTFLLRCFTCDRKQLSA